MVCTPFERQTNTFVGTKNIGRLHSLAGLNPVLPWGGGGEHGEGQRGSINNGCRAALRLAVISVCALQKSN